MEIKTHIFSTKSEIFKASKIPLKNSSDVSRQEDWERSAVANLSYQELQHNYQSDALQSSLERYFLFREQVKCRKFL